MARVLIHVEGQTEETFVNAVLCPHLHDHGLSVSARLLGNARQRNRRGGIRSWPTAKKEILNHLREDSSCVASTMVDYYGLPRTGPGAWPGRETAATLPFPQRADAIQAALLADLRQAMGPAFDPSRFIPYVMMHEFEAMLFSDCAKFGRAIGREDLAPQFQLIRNAFGTPEEIDDSPVTAPSKRVEALMPGYQKPLLGTLAAEAIGLAAIRAECPNFRSWLERLEALPRS